MAAAAIVATCPNVFDAGDDNGEDRPTRPLFPRPFVGIVYESFAFMLLRCCSRRYSNQAKYGGGGGKEGAGMMTMLRKRTWMQPRSWRLNFWLAAVRGVIPDPRGAQMGMGVDEDVENLSLNLCPTRSTMGDVTKAALWLRGAD